MAIYHQDIADIELNSGSVLRTFLGHTIGKGDSAANRFGVRVFRDGAAESLSNVACQGYFRNATGENIALTSYGNISGNVAYITLPQACYNVEGTFTLAIKLVGGGVTGTMRIIDGMVDNTNIDSPVAPTGSVPTYQEVLSVFEQMQDVLDDYTAKVAEQDVKIEGLRNSIAQNYDDLTYPVLKGTYCNHNGLYYRAKNDIEEEPAAWTSSQWTPCYLAGDISYLSQQRDTTLDNKIEGVRDAVAQNYDDLTYPVAAGTYCNHNGLYYRAKQDIAEQPESWTSSQWTVCYLADDITYLSKKRDAELAGQISDTNSTLTAVNKMEDNTGILSFNDWMLGNINSSGQETDAGNWARSGRLPGRLLTASVSAGDESTWQINACTFSNNGTMTHKNSSVSSSVNIKNMLETYGGDYVRILLHRTDNADISLANAPTISITYDKLANENDIADLQNKDTELGVDLETITGTVLYPFLPGRIVTSAAVGETLSVERDSFTSVCSAIIPVTANDKIHVELTPRDNSDARWYVFTNNNYVILSKAGAGSAAVDEILTAPQNGYLIVNALAAYRHLAYDGVVDLADKMNGMEENVYSITGTHSMDFEPGIIPTNIAVGETASLERDSLTNVGSAYIKVKKGYAVTIKGRPRDNGKSRYYMFLDNNLKVLSKALPGSANVNETVFAPADGYAVVNLYTNEAYEATVGVFNVSGKVMEIDGKVSKMAGNILYNYGNLKLKTSAICPESCTWVGDTLITGFPSDVESTPAQTARIYIFTFGNGFDHDYTARKWFAHDWGHLNTIDYSAVNDALITTNGGQGVVNEPDPNGNGHIYIFPKFSRFIENVEHDSTVNYEDYAVTVDGVTYTPIDITLSHSATEWANDAKYQAVWDNIGISVDGEMDNGSIILVSGIYGDTENKIAKLRVCTLGVSNGAFNGNITVNKTYQFLSSDIADTDFVQDMCLVNGAIYINNSETNTELWECVLDIESATVNVIKHRRNMPKESGNRWRSGIAYKDGMFAVGFNSAGLWFENLPNR